MKTVTVPVTLDHNRMIVAGEILLPDSTWRSVRLWVDSGNPEFLLSENLARDLDHDSARTEPTREELISSRFIVSPEDVRIGTMAVDLKDIPTQIIPESQWLFKTMHCDANIPSTVLNRYRVIFDYPARKMTLAVPGGDNHRGIRCDARINPETGIVQIEACIGEERLSLALDNGASYSFFSEDVFDRLLSEYPEWNRITGAIGCANIWGWWPREDEWPITCIPSMLWGSVELEDVGIVGLPNYFRDGSGLFDWYSKKSAYPVDGLLGPNAFRAFRVEIDYPNDAVYFEKTSEFDRHDLDIVGVTLRLETNGAYRIVGIAGEDGKRFVTGLEAGDTLVSVDGLSIVGVTMGDAVDALRGNPGDLKNLVVERDGEIIRVQARVHRFK